MRKWFTFLTAAALATTIGLAPAQPPEGRGKGGGMMMRGMQAMLIAVPKVQDELKLTDDQKAKFKQMADDARAKIEEGMAKAREGGGPPDFQKMQEAGREMMEAAEKKTKAILTDDQFKRYEQIKWQQAGVGAFKEKRVQDALNLTGEQKEKVAGVAEEFDRDAREIRQESRGNPREMQEKMTALRKEAMDKVEGTLTDKQKGQWKELVGTPFELKPEDFQGMGGRGKGGDRRPGGKGEKKSDPPKKIDDAA